MSAPTRRNEELVRVVGPVDSAPGKKMEYRPRLMPRGLAESRGAKRLGIHIVPDYVDRVVTDTSNRVTFESAVAVDTETLKAQEERIKQLEAAIAEMAAKKNKKPGRKPKATSDADQA